MKTGFWLLFTIMLAGVQAADHPPSPPALHDYRQVLGLIPKDMEPQNARHWSAAEKETANLILKRKLVETGRRGSFVFRAEGVEDWGQLTLWSHLSSDEGYPVRLFAGKFVEGPVLARLASIRRGDWVKLEGTFVQAKFEDLWGGPSFSICFEHCTLTKVRPNGQPIAPSPSLPVTIVSAVYGSGDQFADVTQRVQAILAEPGTQLSAKPNWLGADPTPGWNKTLVVVYETQDQRHLFSCGEGGALSADLLTRWAARK